MYEKLNDEQRESLHRIAKDAIEMQDACNIGGVSIAFRDAVLVLQQIEQVINAGGTDWINEHPIIRMYVSKFIHLAKFNNGMLEYSHADDHVASLVKMIDPLSGASLKFDTFVDFKIAVVSSNSNSFGLHNHVLVARDGTAFGVERHRGAHQVVGWNKGDVVRVTRHRGKFNWNAFGETLVSRMANAPVAVISALWKDTTNDGTGSN